MLHQKLKLIDGKIYNMKNRYLMIFLLTYFTFSSAYANIITVDDDGGADFITIQAAVDAASDGDTIRVMPGIYRECIDLGDKSLVLLGTSPENTIIEKCDQRELNGITGNKRYTIKNFTIIGNDRGWPGIEGDVEAANNNIRNFDVAISARSGIIMNNKIEHNNTGVFVHADSIKIISNIINENDDGIFILYEQTNNCHIIKNNEIYNNNYGISYEIGSYYPNNGDSSLIIGNNIHNNLIGIHYLCPTIAPPQTMSNQKPLSDNIIDAKSNWWGTVVEDSIAKYIFDQNDDEDNTAIVDFNNWLEQKADTFHYECSTGVRYNNIFNNSYFNIFASIPGPNSSVKHHNRKKNESFLLNQNYPNPFNSVTKISFTLSDNKTVHTVLQIYNIQGQNIRTIFSGMLPSGTYQYEWDGKDNSGMNVPSGIYFYQLSVRNYSQIKKAILIR